MRRYYRKYVSNVAWVRKGGRIVSHVKGEMYRHFDRFEVTNVKNEYFGLIVGKGYVELFPSVYEGDCVQPFIRSRWSNITVPVIQNELVSIWKSIIRVGRGNAYSA